MTNKINNSIVYHARLHWIIFLWPIIFFVGMLCLGQIFPVLGMLPDVLSLIALLWVIAMLITYSCSSLIIKEKQVILCTGVLVRQTLDLSLNKIESVDIRQSILGSLFHYGSLVITGTGGTRQFINYLNKPLTCRRYIEQLMHT